jgi:hypothetical protein
MYKSKPRWVAVAFQVLMPEDSSSNSEASSIYSFNEVCPSLGLLQPQWNPYPTLTPPSCWVRHVCSIGGPQYGLAVCCVVSACNSTDSKEISNDGNPSHPHLFASFQHSSLDGTQAGPIKPFGTPSTNFYTQHTIHWSPGQLMVY